MSNTSTNYAELNVTNDDMKEVLAEGPQEPVAAEAAPKKKRNALYRILALLLAAAPIVCLCLLKVNLLVSTSAGYAVYGEKTFLDAFLALFKKDGLADFYKAIAGAPADFGAYKFMGLTVLASGTVGKLMSLFLYVIPAAMVVTVVLMIVALCSGKAAPAMTRAIVFINFWVYAAYAAAMLAVSLYYGNIERTFDIVMLAIAGASFLFYLIFSFIKAGKGTWMTFVLFLLTAAFAGVCVYGITQSAQAFKTLFASKDNSIINSLTKGDFYKYAIVALAGIAGLASVISSIRMTTKKGYTFDLIRYLFHVLLAAALVYLAFTEKAFDGTKFYLYAFIALAIAAVQVLLVIVVLCAKKKAKKLAAPETKEAPAEETEAPAETKEEAAEETTAVETTVAEETPAETQEEETEEAGVYAEAVRYEGPTAETAAPEAEELAQPAEETAQPEAEPAPQPAPVYNYNFAAPAAPQSGAGNTADYDFYNSRSFDPFIASLNGDEREQFTEIFILKYKGDTKNLPDYQVGGDNTEFFRKVFIYLGQYRDRIPDSLLAKMYQFAIRK